MLVLKAVALFSVAPSLFSRRQTLRLLPPTTIFSGDYTCKVPTFTVEEMKVRCLLVYGKWKPEEQGL